MMGSWLVEDWDGYESVVDYAFSRLLRIQTSEHPLLIAEPTHNTTEQREKLAELAFEKLNVPALYLQRNAVLSTCVFDRNFPLILITSD